MNRALDLQQSNTKLIIFSRPVDADNSAEFSCAGIHQRQIRIVRVWCSGISFLDLMRHELIRDVYMLAQRSFASNKFNASLQL